MAAQLGRSISPFATQPRTSTRPCGKSSLQIQCSGTFIPGSSSRKPDVSTNAFVQERASSNAATSTSSPSPAVDILERSLSLEVAERPEVATGASLSRQSKRKILLAEGEVLHSTWEHKAWVWGTTALMAGTFVQGFSKVEDLTGAAWCGLAAVSAYFVSDFATGVYHWSVDNYGGPETPVVGGQIAAFQGHHQRPWTITQREFSNNVHKVFKPAAPFAAVCLAISPWTPAAFDVWMSTFIFLNCMSQQFHAWSHMKKSELPGPIIALQDAGLLISRKAHGAHHKAPFEGNYCIVSGFWNDMLDENGSDTAFFRRLESFVAARTGVEPRCWYEPSYTWEANEEDPVA